MKEEKPKSLFNKILLLIKNLILWSGLLLFWLIYASSALDESKEALEYTGGSGPMPSGYSIALLALVLAFLMRRKVFTRKISLTGIIAKIIVVLILVLGLWLQIDFDKQKLMLSASSSPEPAPYSVMASTPTPSPSIKPQATKKVITTTTSANNVDCIGPDGKQFTTSMEECKSLNEKWGKPVDYMVNCEISDKCGGGSLKMKKSDCNNTICCTYPDKAVFMTDKSKCVSAPTQQQNTTSTKVAFTTNYASVKGTYYCIDQAVNRILNQEEKSVKDAYDFMQNGCAGGYSDTYCQSATDMFKRAQSDLDSDIRQYCP